jgi:hypothetical protein
MMQEPLIVNRIMKIILPILENQKKPWSGLIVLTYLMCFCILIINLLFFKIAVINFVLLGLVILFGFILGIVKNDTITGNIFICEHVINVNGTRHNVEELELIEISINGFEGRKGLDNIKSFYSDDGMNNYFSLTKNNCSTKYQIILSEKNYNLILLLAKKWKNENVKFILLKNK